MDMRYSGELDLLSTRMRHRRERAEAWNCIAGSCMLSDSLWTNVSVL